VLLERVVRGDIAADRGEAGADVDAGPHADALTRGAGEILGGEAVLVDDVVAVAVEVVAPGLADGQVVVGVELDSGDAAIVALPPLRGEAGDRDGLPLAHALARAGERRRRHTGRALRVGLVDEAVAVVVLAVAALRRLRPHRALVVA